MFIFPAPHPGLVRLHGEGLPGSEMCSWLTRACYFFPVCSRACRPWVLSWGSPRKAQAQLGSLPSPLSWSVHTQP